MSNFDNDVFLASENLFEELKKGSLIAYELLFKKYYRMLCLEAMMLLDDQEKSEDIVQELFIEFWDKKIYKKVNRSVKSYLYRAVRNRCFNELKRRKVTRRRETDYFGYKSHLNNPCWLEREELKTRMEEVLLELPTQRKRAFTLVYIEEMKYHEAAAEMGVSINSVKTHLRLALRVLRSKLSTFR